MNNIESIIRKNERDNKKNIYVIIGVILFYFFLLFYTLLTIGGIDLIEIFNIIK